MDDVSLAPRARDGRATVAALGSLGAMLVYGVILAVFKWVPLYDCVVLVPLLAVTFRALDRAPPRLRATTLAGLSAILAAALLVRLWTLGYEGRNAIFGGILPWSDSGDFFSDALRLVHGERFTPSSSRRPLFSALLAGLLKLGGGNLRFALAVLAAVDALAVALPALELWRTHGWKSALFVYLIAVFFLRRWTGFVQTEHFGLPMGAIGFAFLWRAGARGHGFTSETGELDRSAAGAALLGVFALALGLFARAGCFFVLPALAIWGMCSSPSGHRLKLLAAFVAVTAVAWSVHEAVLRAVGTGASFSDYPAIFYGLLHGEDFTYLAQTHPGLDDLPGGERAAALWAVALGELRKAPLLLPIGLTRSFIAFFTSPYGLFSCLWTNPDEHIFEDLPLVRGLWQSGGPLALLGYWRRSLGVFSIVNAVAMGALGAAFVVAFVVGAVKLLRPTSDPSRSVLGAVVLGILASVPFMPPWITSGMQIQTVTLAFAAAVPAVLIGDRVDGPPAQRTISTRGLGLAMAAGLVAFFVLLGWVRVSPRLPPATAATAGSTDPGEWVDVYASSTVEVAPARSLSFRKKGIEDLGENIRFMAKHCQDFTSSIVPSLVVGTLFHSAYDPARGQWEILIDEGRHLEGRDGWVKVRSAPRNAPRVQTLLAP